MPENNKEIAPARKFLKVKSHEKKVFSNIS